MDKVTLNWIANSMRSTYALFGTELEKRGVLYAAHSVADAAELTGEDRKDFLDWIEGKDLIDDGGLWDEETDTYVREDT